MALISSPVVRPRRRAPAVVMRGTPATPRLTAEQTPYRSVVYVTGRHSADGNSYSPGQPIPRAEAVRQRIITPAGAPDVNADLCPKCRGTGRRNRHASHRPDCGCVGCGNPCKGCGGLGLLMPPVAERSSHASST